MNNTLWAISVAACTCWGTAFGQTDRLPFGSVETLISEAERNANAIRVWVRLQAGTNTIPIAVPDLFQYHWLEDGVLEECIRTRLADTLAEVPTTDLSLAGRSLMIYYSAVQTWQDASGAEKEVNLLFMLQHARLKEHEGRLFIPEVAYEVDISTAVKTLALTPIFLPGVERAEIEIPAQDGAGAERQDSAGQKSPFEVRISKDSEGILYYPTFLATSGKSGRVALSFTGGRTQVFENADGRLIDGYGVIRMSASRLQDSLILRFRGDVEGKVGFEMSTNLLDWTPLPYQLTPEDFVGPRIEGPARFFRARVFPFQPEITISHPVP